MKRPDWHTVPCRDYQGSLDHSGYGNQNRPAQGLYGAHRVAWVAAYGKIPRGRWVLHLCHRRICTEPLHLYLGDARQNVADRQAAGRQARGEGHGNSRLKNAQVMEIKRRLTSESDASLARKFGVTRNTISHIRTGHTWGWLTGARRTA